MSEFPGNGERLKALQEAGLGPEALSMIVELVEEVEGLQAAKEHAATINQAKGVIMSTMHCSANAAFAVLIAASQRENIKLYKLAERIAAAQNRDT